MGTRKSIRVGICLAVAALAALPAARLASGQTAPPLRYVFGTNSFTDSKGETWSPIPTSDLGGSASWYWSTCAKEANFTATTDPGLYREQVVETSGDLVLTVPVPSGSYIVNLYFAEPCSYFAPGSRVFGVVLNGTTIVPSLDLAATAGVERPVVESASVSGSKVVLDLKRITQAQVIAAIEILPSPTFQVAAKLKWDDGTPIAGMVLVTQEISTNPVTSQSLGNFPLDANGTATASLTPDLTQPLTFSFALIAPTGSIAGTLTVSCTALALTAFPRTLNPSIILNRSSATVKSISF
jgi:malectin (di-glucose binding ER protein)